MIQGIALWMIKKLIRFVPGWHLHRDPVRKLKMAALDWMPKDETVLDEMPENPPEVGV